MLGLSFLFDVCERISFHLFHLFIHNSPRFYVPYDFIIDHEFMLNDQNFKNRKRTQPNSRKPNTNDSKFTAHIRLSCRFEFKYNEQKKPTN